MTRKLVSEKKSRKNVRLPLYMLLIAMLFITSLFLSNYLKTREPLFEMGTINKGQTLTPPTAITSFDLTTATGGNLPKDLLTNKWGLIYIAPQACQEDCIENIFKMQKIKDEIRVKSPPFYTMVITNEHDAKTNPVFALIRKCYPTTFYIAMNNKDLTQLFKSLPVGTQTKNFEVLYIANNQGYLVKSYPPSEAGIAVLRNLRDLIKR